MSSKMSWQKVWRWLMKSSLRRFSSPMPFPKPSASTSMPLQHKYTAPVGELKSLPMPIRSSPALLPKCARAT